MAFSLSQILHSRLQIIWGAKGAFELRSLIRKRNQTNQLQTKLLTSGPGGRRFKSSLPDHLFSAIYNRVKKCEPLVTHQGINFILTRLYFQRLNGGTLTN